MKEETTNFYSGRIKTDNDSQVSGSQHRGTRKSNVPDYLKTSDLKNSMTLGPPGKGSDLPEEKANQLRASTYRASIYDINS